MNEVVRRKLTEPTVPASYKQILQALIGEQCAKVTKFFVVSRWYPQN